MNRSAYTKYLLTTLECNSEDALKSLIQEDYQSFHSFNSVVYALYSSAKSASEHNILKKNQFQLIDSAMKHYQRNIKSMVAQLETKIL